MSGLVLSEVNTNHLVYQGKDSARVYGLFDPFDLYVFTTWIRTGKKWIRIQVISLKFTEF